MAKEANATSRPILVYDGECSFCRRWIRRWRAWTGGRIAYAPYQEAAGDFPGIPLERFRESVVLIEPDGRVSHSAEAVARSLAVRPVGKALLWIYLRLPGARAVSEAAYRWVSRHRGRWPLR